MRAHAGGIAYVVGACRGMRSEAACVRRDNAILPAVPALGRATESWPGRRGERQSGKGRLRKQCVGADLLYNSEKFGNSFPEPKLE